jgi:acetyl-CoA decarbonylase/synthase complex subunit epsilon
MSMAEPWQKAEIAGPKKALVILKPEVIVAMVKKAKRPVLVVGHEAVNVEVGEGNLIDQAINIANARKMAVVATAHIVGEFIKRGFKDAALMPAVDIAKRLEDPDWKGLDGAGQYDLALFMGIPYYMEWVILSSLKHFSNMKTICLDRYYQPNASWSFPNISPKDLNENLKIIVNSLGGK